MSTKKLADYSAAVPSAKALKDDGFTGVIRYVSPARAAWMGAKPMSRAEVQDLQAHGLDIAVCWQYGPGTAAGSDVMRGRAGGVADAKAADAHLKSIGLEGWPVFFCADFDATLHQYNSTIRPYLEGAASVIGKDRVGLYGHSRILHWAGPENKVIAEVAPGRFLGWQTRSWSAGVIATRYAVLYQRVHNVPGPQGIQIDINDQLHDYFGQRPPSSVATPPTPPAPPTPPQEPPVTSQYRLTGTQFSCDVAIYGPNSGWRDPFACQYGVIHTTENGDTATPDNVARWQQNPANSSSYNVLFGVDGRTVRGNDDNRRPWSAGEPGNTKGIHGSAVGQAARSREHWFRFPKQLESIARWCADLHLRYGLPLVWLTPADVRAKRRGFCSHGTVFHGDGGPAFRSDPGAGFPHDWVLNRARELVTVPKGPNDFPLPKGWYYGPLEGPNESISGRFGTELKEWIDGLQRWQKAVGVPETGVWDDATAKVATELQKERGWPNNPNWPQINGGFGGVYEGEWNAVIQEGWRPGPKPDPEPTPKPDPAPEPPEPQTPEEPEVPGAIIKRAGKITDVSGPDFTRQYGINATDLGISVRMQNGEILTIFGDSFSGNRVGEGEWRSPVGLISKTTPAGLESGIKWDRAAGPDPRDAVQLLPYDHNNGTFSTVLPSDLVVLPDGTIVMHVMVNQGLGNVLWTELQVSRDNATSWQHSGIKFDGNWNAGFRQLWTMEYNPDDGFVYALSTGFQRNKGLILHRIHWQEILKPGSESRWEPWGFRDGKWAWGNPATVVLPGQFGELYLRRLDKGYWTLTYFNAERYRIDCMVFDSPTANLHTARAEQKTLLHGGAWGRESDTHVAQLYCGCPIPGSTPDRWHYIVSQWNTADSAAGRRGWPYKSMHFVNSIPVPKGYTPPQPEAPVVENPDEPQAPAPSDPKGSDPVDDVPPEQYSSGGGNFMDSFLRLILGLFGLGR